MSFYRCRFWDKRDRQSKEHYVFTENIERAKKQFEFEEPYVELTKWVKVEEEDLPDLVVVIRK